MGGGTPRAREDGRRSWRASALLPATKGLEVRGRRSAAPDPRTDESTTTRPRGHPPVAAFMRLTEAPVRSRSIDRGDDRNHGLITICMLPWGANEEKDMCMHHTSSIELSSLIERPGLPIAI